LETFRITILSGLSVSGCRDDGYSEVGGSGGFRPGGAVGAGEFAFGGLQAGLEALDFAEPAVDAGLGDAVGEVGDDLQ
jgi:hypothetical protein